CGRLFVPERSDAKYCKEGGCQRKAFWTDERHRDYEYVRRYLRIADDCTKQRHGFSIAHLRKTLNKPTVKEKLQKIEQLWKEDWPQVSKKAKKLRRIAAERPNCC